MLDQPWISLDITVDGHKMILKLLNGKSVKKLQSENCGIGIRNVQERLTLIYPDKHELIITEEEEVFIVNLRIDLVKVTTIGLKPVEALTHE